MGINLKKLFRSGVAVSLLLISGNIFSNINNAFAQNSYILLPEQEKTNALAIPANQLSPESIMDGVNPQRTGVYQTKGVHRLGSLLWKYEKLFPKMNYSGATMTASDGSPVMI